uniref:Caspase 4 n=1 Tax=Rhinopithecus bieti TaxID=61621 RepID=A0A2K6LQX6_RHIBE
LTEGNQRKKPLKMLESLGKDFLTGVLDNLVEQNVLNWKEEEKKKYYDAKTEDKVRVMADSIQEKQRMAGQMLLQTFFNIDQISPSKKAHPNIEAGPPESGESIDALKLCPHEEFLRLCKERAEEIYPIKERNDRTRLALIICNTEFDHLPPRNGADFDITGMKELLEGLDYSVDVEENLTARTALERHECSEHKSSTARPGALMSSWHLPGGGNLAELAHDEKTQMLLAFMTCLPDIQQNRNWPQSKDKPKVIHFNVSTANRGELWVRDSPASLEVASSQSPENLEEDAVYKTHVEKDFIAFCSSTPHNVSWRDSTMGSVFITQLITCFQKYSWCCHLEEVFRKVQQSFETPRAKAQMPTIERLSMTRYFYLFPGN